MSGFCTETNYVTKGDPSCDGNSKYMMAAILYVEVDQTAAGSFH